MKLKTIGKNQTEIMLQNGAVVFFSYNTPVAAQLAQGGFVRTEKHFSVTTSHHINQWLDGAQAKEVSQEMIEKISGGEFNPLRKLDGSYSRRCRDCGAMESEHAERPPLKLSGVMVTGSTVDLSGHANPEY